VTKDDLKTLAQLPKVLAVLRKLAGEASEVEKVLGRLNVMPRIASQASGTESLRVPPVKLGQNPEPALEGPAIPHGIVNAYDPEVEGETPPLTPAQMARAERAEALEALRKDPVRAALLSQFAHDGGTENGAPVHTEMSLNLSGD
jgi:hypothetical protein